MHSMNAKLTMAAVAKGQAALAAASFTVLSDPMPGKVPSITGIGLRNCFLGSWII